MMRYCWLHIVLEESQGPAHKCLDYSGYAYANPTTWNARSMLGRGGAPLSVLSTSVLAVPWLVIGIQHSQNARQRRTTAVIAFSRVNSEVGGLD